MYSKIFYFNIRLRLAQTHALRVSIYEVCIWEQVLIITKKAFDTVNHDILLLTLNKIGLRGVCNTPLGTYFNMRMTAIVQRK